MVQSVARPAVEVAADPQSSRELSPRSADPQGVRRRVSCPPRGSVALRAGQPPVASE